MKELSLLLAMSTLLFMCAIPAAAQPLLGAAPLAAAVQPLLEAAPLAASTSPPLPATETTLFYQSGKLKIRALLYRPAPPSGTSRPTRFPGIIYNHDGVDGITPMTRHWCRNLAAQGFVILAPSYRGEDGSEGMVEVAKGEVDDALAALDLLAKRAEVDPRHLAMVGTSHGALISILAASRTSRLAAVVAGYGVMDPYSWWEHLQRNHFDTSDPLTRRTFGLGPDDRPASFRIRDARRVASRIKCPVLILQGEKDLVVPPGQARELDQALRAAAVPVSLRLYPDAGHGFLIYAEPGPEFGPREIIQARQANDELVVFLQKHLQ